MLTAFAVSDIGLKRTTNEDAFLSDLDLGLFCVADGLGGHNAGEVAARLSLDAIAGFVRRTRDTEDVSWPFGVDRELSFDGNRLVTAVKLANQSVFLNANLHEDRFGMGTTIVAALVTGRRATYVSVGDSRIYSFRHGRLSKLTTDDSLSSVRLRHLHHGPLDAVESDGMRHVLTKAVGPSREISVPVSERDLAPDEILLLSSDGLHGFVDDAMIETILRTHRSLEGAARQLVQTALELGGTDNATAVLLRHDADASA